MVCSRIPNRIAKQRGTRGTHTVASLFQAVASVALIRIPMPHGAENSARTGQVLRRA